MVTRDVADFGSTTPFAVEICEEGVRLACVDRQESRAGSTLLLLCRFQSARHFSPSPQGDSTHARRAHLLSTALSLATHPPIFPRGERGWLLLVPNQPTAILRSSTTRCIPRCLVLSPPPRGRAAWHRVASVSIRLISILMHTYISIASELIIHTSNGHSGRGRFRQFRTGWCVLYHTARGIAYLLA